ncbi:Transposable element Tcb1 transposase [Chionoecetes opilio]|uniref:Transposable element Tcb1 transposase n=1 Tax=Chionoecetes opilio TaxID=41210 RepID=A0A8J5C0Y0_CHIOP|nr:Transposable element Tcb1 transposase [Chionoecetes opilio]
MKYLARFREEKSGETPSQKLRPGHPRKISHRSVNVPKRSLESTPRVTARVLKENNPEVFGAVSVRIVSRRVHELGYTSQKPLKKPLLTRAQRARRVTFTKKYLAWTDGDWLSVLWSDEATFTVTCNRGARVYRRPGSDPLESQYVESTVKHPDSLMVWGCFSGRGLGKLVVLPKNLKVNQAIYLELLCEHLPDSFELTRASVFQQDGAPAHTAKSVTQWLDDCMVPFIKDWPGNSPDLNPIENLWHMVKKDLQGKDVSSIPKLEKAIRESWANTSPEHLRNLALSLPRRLQAVKKSKGHPTN